MGRQMLSGLKQLGMPSALHAILPSMSVSNWLDIEDKEGARDRAAAAIGPQARQDCLLLSMLACHP